MTLLTLSDLATYPSRTNKHKINMALLAEFYQTYLFPNYYDFQLSDGATIRIDFHKKNFCHLVGIEQIAEEHFGSSDDKMFMHKGTGGFKRAKKGKLEFSYLKNLHQHQYDYEEEKFYNFHFLHTMMESGNLKLVNYNAIPNSTITCDFMFHDTYDNALLHLGVEESTANTGIFFPKTFFPRYLSTNNADAYITPQTPVGIKSMTKVLRP